MEVDTPVTAPDAGGIAKEMSDVFELIPQLVYAVERRADARWRIPPRQYERHNLIVLLGGELTAVIDGVSHRVARPGGYVLFKPGTLHSAVTNPNNLMHCYALEFRLLDPSVGWSSIHFPLPDVGELVAADPVLTQFRELLYAWQVRPVGYQLQVRSRLMDILYTMFRQHHLQDVDTHKIRLVEEAVAFIRRNYRRSLTLEEIASHTGLSPTYFGTVFRQVMGSTPIQYLNETRVRIAQELLRTTKLSIDQIAERVGVNSHTHFSRMFKRHTGMSPRAYRKLY